ncbi:MAG: diguanylate cyclase [Comamonas sp.]|nr:diguanylate cyclase [Comamonas sp.]
MTAPPPRLLIVDDQPINIQSLHQIFQADHTVLAATSAAQALALCQRQPPPDLILLDIIMPEMDGLALCRLLKADALTADIPIIFVTAQSSSEEESAALEAGGVDFISKPVNPAVVRARVKTHLTLKAQSDFLRSLAFMDGLTGVANRRRFNEALDSAWRHSLRQRESLGLVMMDIDHFKRYNDHYGHQQGDTCLQAVAQTLQQHMQRPYDLLARYGGEEFVCLLPGCNHQATLDKAEQLRRAIADLALPHAQSPTASHVTLSLGAVALELDATPSELPPSLTAQALLQQADTALYTAKNQGRNQVASKVFSPAAAQ